MRDFAKFDWQQPLAGFDPWKIIPDGCKFYPKRAADYCRFMESHIKLARGDGWMGNNIELMDWQALTIGWLFGWMYEDFRRRFDTVFILIPKKNGKSGFTSALAATLFIADGETDKKVYCAAKVKDQASIVFNDATYMVLNSGVKKSALKGYNDLSRKKVIYTPTHSLLTAISCDAKNTEGVEPSAAIVDELHILPDPHLIDVLRKGMVTRKNPLLIMLSTAAHQGDNVCNTEMDYAMRVRDGILDDPSYLPVLFIPDEKDDWKDEKVWFKVNPGLGKTIRIERFRKEAEKANGNAKLELEFKRLNLNMQGKDTSQWVDLADWKACPCEIAKESLLGQPCTMGIDLSATHDITAIVLYFPRQNALLPFFFVPKQTASERDDYLIWKKSGLIDIAGNAAISEEEVRKKIQLLVGGYDEEKKERIKGLYDCRAVAFDPWRMASLSAKLKEVDELNMIPFRQGFVSMAEPTAKMEAEIIEHRLVHFNNPVLTWMVSNAVAKLDPKGNTQLVKDDPNSKRKIDGIIASIMAFGVYIRTEVQELFNDNIEVRFL